ncbi:MAG: CRISPR-associated helicase Cas3' [Metallosphaera sp.]
MESTSSLSDIYKDICSKENVEPRDKITETLDEIENGHSVILTAPTGYGKTSITKALAVAAVQGNDNFDRVIHVLPYRSIVQDLTAKLRYSLAKIGLNQDLVGAQDMDFHDSPYFLLKANVTTLDTFVLNLFKLPVAEIDRGLNGLGTHFEVPRGAIYSSIVVFDEFHLFSEDGKPLTSAIASLKSLGSMGVPFIIATATMPDSVKSLIEESLIKEGVSLTEVNVIDSPVKRSIDIRFESDLPRIDTEKRTLIVFNTRTEAINAYRKLKGLGYSPLLIHSKFSSRDRVEKVNKIVNRNEQAKLVISTQVIEAGVDVSFDTLITEAAPLPNLIQRAGRVARYGGEGEVIIIPFMGKVYERSEVDQAVKLIEENNVIDHSLMQFYKVNVDVDPSLRTSLNMIDDVALYTSGATTDLLEEVCSLTRDVSLVMGFPHGCTSPECAVPLTDQEAKDLINAGNMIVKNGQFMHPSQARLKSLKDCLPLQFLKLGIDGVVIESYDKEEGAII